MWPSIPAFNALWRSSSKAFAVIAKMGMPAFAASGSSAGKAAAAGTATLPSCAERTASGRTAAGSACCWTLLLAVPACWGMWSSRVYLTAAAPAQTQAETTTQLHEKKFLPGFAENVWETASLDSKTELAKQLAAYELAMLGVPDGTEVTVQPLDEDRLGYYSAASRQIVLSRSVLESGTAQETMDTIAHEAYHAQQAYVVENIDWDDAATQAAYYDQARRWLRNYQSGYVSGDEDILGYYFQPVEADARAYAKEETERLQELISRNLQEDK